MSTVAEGSKRFSRTGWRAAADWAVRLTSVAGVLAVAIDAVCPTCWRSIPGEEARRGIINFVAFGSFAALLAVALIFLAVRRDRSAWRAVLIDGFCAATWFLAFWVRFGWWFAHNGVPW